MSIAEYLEVIKNFTATDILFYLFILVVSWLLLWALIPDGLKQYWKYISDTKKEQAKLDAENKKDGKDRRPKYTFSFKR